MSLRPPIACILALAALAFPARLAAQGTEPNADGAPVASASQEEVALAFDELGAADFRIRQEAGERLIAWSADEAGAALVAAEANRRALASELSFEARTLLAPLSLPLAHDAEPRAALDELDKLISLSDAPQYDVRVRAQVRLASLGEQPDASYTVTERIKQELRSKRMSFGAAKRLQEIWRDARLHWIAGDPASWPPVDASDSRIAGWIRTAARPEGGAAAEDAERELLDLMARDEQLPRLRAAIDAQWQATPLEAMSERLQRLHTLTRPQLVAEIWTEHRNSTLQWLIVGEPQYPEEALRPTHFDRVDGSTVHCVSGNSLAEGDYPLGVANPPSRRDPQIHNEGVAFHLIHLPTPRSRWVYERERRVLTEEQRLAALTERTLRFMIERGRAMSEREAAMLPQLDADVLSARIGEYFAKIDDVPCPADAEFNVVGATSRHAMACWTLALYGTSKAGPAILEAINAGRFQARSPTAPYDLPMIAALSIAARDPWQGVDEWLAGMLDRDDVLILGQDDGPQLAASAAALLLGRAGMPLADFDMNAVEDAHLQQLGCPAYRFSDPAARDKVRQWWAERRRNVVSRADDMLDRL